MNERRLVRVHAKKCRKRVRGGQESEREKHRVLFF